MYFLDGYFSFLTRNRENFIYFCSDELINDDKKIIFFESFLR